MPSLSKGKDLHHRPDEAHDDAPGGARKAQAALRKGAVSFTHTKRRHWDLRLDHLFARDPIWAELALRGLPQPVGWSKLTRNRYLPTAMSRSTN